MKQLFFDIDVNGHHTEYIHHIVNFIVDKNLQKEEFFFVVHPHFTRDFNFISDKVKHLSNVTFIEVKEEELLDLNINNRIKRSLNNFNLMNSYAVRLEADVCYLMHLNVFQIALGLKRMSYKVKGILFMQFTNMKVNSLRSYYYYLRRYFPFILMNFNKKNIHRVFVLNDKTTAEKLNAKFSSEIYKSLPDPINYVEPEHEVNIKSVYKIGEQDKILLHFGALADRKGTLEVVQSLKFLPKDEKFTLLLIGRCGESELERQLLEEIENYKKEKNINCIWDNRFVSDKRVSTLFSQSDYILMPYKNSEASSGVLGHAIAHQKKVIAPQSGLIGELVKGIEMGVTLPNTHPQNIAKAVLELECYSINISKYKKFNREHSPSHFTEKLLWE